MKILSYEHVSIAGVLHHVVEDESDKRSFMSVDEYDQLQADQDVPEEVVVDENGYDEELTDWIMKRS